MTNALTTQEFKKLTLSERISFSDRKFNNQYLIFEVTLTHVVSSPHDQTTKKPGRAGPRKNPARLDKRESSSNEP